MAAEKSDEQKVAEEFAAANPGPRVMVVPGNDLSGYLGVAPEYMNYADPNSKPYQTEEEAYKYTGLSDDQVLATRERESEFENERPAVAEDTGFDFAENKRREEEAAVEAAEDEQVVAEETPAPASSGSTVTRPPLSGN